MKCNQCEAMVVNGVFIHEIGCPNDSKEFIDGEWISIIECPICGLDVIEGESCSCYGEEIEGE